MKPPPAAPRSRHAARDRVARALGRAGDDSRRWSLDRRARARSREAVAAHRRRRERARRRARGRARRRLRGPRAARRPDSPVVRAHRQPARERDRAPAQRLRAGLARRRSRARTARGHEPPRSGRLRARHPRSRPPGPRAPPQLARTGRVDQVRRRRRRSATTRAACSTRAPRPRPGTPISRFCPT